MQLPSLQASTDFASGGFDLTCPSLGTMTPGPCRSKTSFPRGRKENENKKAAKQNAVAGTATHHVHPLTHAVSANTANRAAAESSVQRITKLIKNSTALGMSSDVAGRGGGDFEFSGIATIPECTQWRVRL